MKNHVHSCDSKHTRIISKFGKTATSKFRLENINMNRRVNQPIQTMHAIKKYTL